jgi:hypothetical protein
MEMNKLPMIILGVVAAALLIGVAMIVYDNIGQVPTSRTVSNQTFTWTWDQDGVNQSLGHENVTKITRFINGSKSAVASADYTLLKDPGIITMTNGTSIPENSSAVYIWYTYQDYQGPTNETMKDNITAVGGIATDWMTLIVTIVVLSIILAMVLKSFTGRR